MHVDEKSFWEHAAARTHVGRAMAVYDEESVFGLVFLIPLSWTLANRRGKKNVSGVHGLYAGKLMGGVGGIISHSSCLRDKAVCLTSHINNVTGTNLPGL